MQKYTVVTYATRLRARQQRQHVQGERFLEALHLHIDPSQHHGYDPPVPLK